MIRFNADDECNVEGVQKKELSKNTRRANGYPIDSSTQAKLFP